MTENILYVRCDKSFCQNRYKVLKVTNSKVEDAICDMCGNEFERVTNKQAKQYFDSEYSIPNSANPKDSFEKLGSSAKSLIKNPSNRMQNIYTTIIVIIVFCLMVAYCGDTGVEEGGPRFFGDVR